MAKTVLRCEKIKSNNVSYSHNHNFRTYENKSVENIDFDRTKLNQLVLGSKNTHEKIKENLTNLKSKKAIRKDANVALEFIFSASPDYFYKNLDKEKFDTLTMKDNKKELNEIFKTLDHKKLEDFKQAVLTFIEETPGFKNNVVNLVLHLDEKSPHLHLLLTPIIENRLTAKEFFTPENARSWQDKFAELTKPLGIERGEKDSASVHTSCKDYNSNIDVSIPTPPDTKNIELNIQKIPLTDKVIISMAELKQRESNQNKKYQFFKKFYTENKETVKKTKQAITENKQLKKDNQKMKQHIQKYNQEQLESLRQIPLEQVISSLGYELKRESQTYSRLKTDNLNLVINTDKNSFADNIGSKNNFGSINLLTEVFKMPFKQATEYLAQKFGFEKVAKEISTNKNQSEKLAAYAIEKSIAEMPKESPKNLENIKSYLIEKRHLSKEIVEEMINKNQLYADKNNNAVFTNELQTYAYIRGTTEKRFVQSKGSMDFITVSNIENPSKVFLFESIIDLLSYRDLNKEEKGLFISIQGSAMSNRLNELNLKSFDQVVCCFDNDKQGQIFTNKVIDLNLSNVTVNKPTNKDFNEDLEQVKKQKQIQLEIEKAKVSNQVKQSPFKKNKSSGLSLWLRS